MEKLPKPIKEEIEALSNQELKELYLDVEKLKFNLFLEMITRGLIDPKRVFETGISEIN